MTTGEVLPDATQAALAANADGGQTTPPEGGDTINQEAVNKVINTKHRQMREAQESRDALALKNQELEGKLSKLNATSAPAITPMPDEYAENYEAGVKAHYESKSKRDAWDTQQQLVTQQAIDQQTTDVKSQQEIVTAAAKVYDQKSVKLNLDKAEMSGLDIMELEKVAAMPAIDAGIYLTKAVTANADKLKTKLTQTPDPLDIDGGRGATDLKNQYLKAVVYS